MYPSDLTTGPVRPRLRSIALPAGIGMFCNTLFNLTDTFFAGRISTHAVAGLSIAFPVFFLILATGAGLGTGTTALMANAIGAKKREEARLLAAQAVSFALLASVVLTAIGLWGAEPLFRFMGARGDYLDTALTYIRVIFYGAVFFLGCYSVNAGLVAAGDTKTFRNVLAAGALLNVGLDPWFIHGGFGVPALGLAGVAWSTILIQGLTFAYMLIRSVRAGILARDSWGMLAPRPAVYWALFKQGAPAALNHLTIALGIFVITYYVSRFGDAAVAAYGIATRVEQVALLPVLGLTSATLAMAGQSNGAGLTGRVREVWHAALREGCLVMAVGGLLLLLFAEPAMRLFTADAEVLAAGVPYLRIAALISFAYVFLFVTTSLLQAIRQPLYAIWIGLYRQLAAPVLVYPLLGAWFGLSGLWFGIGLVTWSAGLFTLWWAHRKLSSTSQVPSSRP